MPISHPLSLLALLSASAAGRVRCGRKGMLWGGVLGNTWGAHCVRLLECAGSFNYSLLSPHYSLFEKFSAFRFQFSVFICIFGG